MTISPLVSAVLPTIRQIWEAISPTYDQGQRFGFAEDDDLAEGASGHRTFTWGSSERVSELAHSSSLVSAEYSFDAELLLVHEGLANGEAMARQIEDPKQLCLAIDAMAGSWPAGVEGVWADKVSVQVLEGQIKRVTIKLRAIVEESNA